MLALPGGGITFTLLLYVVQRQRPPSQLPFIDFSPFHPTSLFPGRFFFTLTSRISIPCPSLHQLNRVQRIHSHIYNFNSGSSGFPSHSESSGALSFSFAPAVQKARCQLLPSLKHSRAYSFPTRLLLRGALLSHSLSHGLPNSSSRPLLYLLQQSKILPEFAFSSFRLFPLHLAFYLSATHTYRYTHTGTHFMSSSARAYQISLTPSSQRLCKGAPFLLSQMWPIHFQFATSNKFFTEF